MKLYQAEVDALKSERASSIKLITKLKQKLLESVKFMTANYSEQTSQPSLLKSLMDHNKEIEAKLAQLELENNKLKSMLLISQDQNSFESFEKEIRLFEDQSTTHVEDKRELSPSRIQEDREKNTNDIVRQTLRDRNKRLGRKRTESFHFSSLGESSSDEENRNKNKKTSLLRLRRKTVQNAFAGYKMQQIMPDEEGETTPKQLDTPQKEEEKKDEPKEEAKEEEKKAPESTPKKALVGKRKRMNSTNTSVELMGLSPPKPSQPRKVSKPSEDSFGALAKNSGYKMQMQAPENKSPTSDSDYFNCFNKNKTKPKRDKRTKSMLNDDEAEQLKLDLKPVSKVKYTICSIQEVEKSSSSTSSIKSSDDLTYKYSTRSKKFKKSSFSNSSMLHKSSEITSEFSSSRSSTKRLRSFKVKKYTEGHITPLFESVEKLKPKKTRRLNSMSMVLQNLELE